MDHIIQYSGGIGSFAAACRVKDRYPYDAITLLFADTRMEDEDLYRFLGESAEYLDLPLVIIADGRTPWEVMKDEKFMGNSAKDPCSKILKRKLMDRWCRANCNPKTTIRHIGIDWTEEHRLVGMQSRMKRWNISGPMTEEPYLDKQDMIEVAAACGIRPPRLYEMGFPHNNCGGFCVKAGQAHFKLLLERMPDRYRWHEQQEQETRDIINAHRAQNGLPPEKYTILRKMIKGIYYPISLKEFREMMEKDPRQCDTYDWGGCGCALG